MKKLFILLTIPIMLVAIIIGGGIIAKTSVDNGQSTISELISTAIADDSTSIISAVDGSALDVTEMFTSRDIEQTPDLEEATYLQLVSDEDTTITQAGTYVISGNVNNCTIIVQADEEDKVQIVLDSVSIVNTDVAAIYVESADKVFITLTGDNSLQVTGSFQTKSLDSVIVSKDDLTINGTGSVTIVSSNGDGITSKDDLKITGGTYNITAINAIKANDSIRIYDGTFNINASKDGLHSENDEDSSLGYIYIYNGTLTISAGDDGIQGNAIVQIDGGIIDIITSTEGIESTYVQINGGTIDIYATDDGINVARKSSYDLIMEINGGTITIDMASGDTDALDSNGSLYINGGVLNITATSAFDYDNIGELNGGTVTVNGQVVTVLTQSQMGGMGNMGGGQSFGGMGSMGGRPSR